MSFKGEMQQMALDLIDGVFGVEGEISQIVTITHPILSAVDPITDTQISGEESFTVYGVVGPWKKDSLSSQQGDKSGANGQQVKTNDQMLKVAFVNLQFIPTADIDTVSLPDGTVYLITFVQIDSASAVATMQLRRTKGASYGFPY